MATIGLNSVPLLRDRLHRANKPARPGFVSQTSGKTPERPSTQHMRIGFLSDANVAQLDWAKDNGFRSVAWMRFDTSFAAPPNDAWQSSAEQLAAEARFRGLRISAIGALHSNPLDPGLTEFARAVFIRAIDVASHIGVKTVSGFPGGSD